MGRFNKVVSVLVTGIIAMSGLPSAVLADVINAPTYYAVQSGLEYEITTNVTSSWINHVSVDFVISNTGNETIHNWYLTFNTPYVIDNIWNGTLYETDGNGTYTITSNGWNQDIHPGETVTVGATFSSAEEDALTIAPEWYLLNTQATVVDTSLYTLDYIEYSTWETGFTGQLTLQPQVDCQHWSLIFTSNRAITAVSSAELNAEEDGSYEITHDENNMRLFANNAYNFGIQGVNTEEPLEFTDIELTVVDLAYHLTDDVDGNGTPDYIDFMDGASIVGPTPTPTVSPTEDPTETPTEEPTETITPTDEPTPTPDIDYELDRDLDGLPDYIEDQIGTDPLKPDTDGDGLSDLLDLIGHFDPTRLDTNNDGIADGSEDSDNDGLPNTYELLIGTNFIVNDTDNDYMLDGDEIYIYGTDPLNPDSDSDGLLDGDEVSIGKNPIDSSDRDIRVLQSVSRNINNIDDLTVISVDVSASVANKIDRILNIRDYYNVDVYSTDVYGRIGSPINFECDESIDSATVVIHYDETQLGNTEEGNLGVLWYDEDNGIYVIQEQAVVDSANNTITLVLDHFSTYVVVDLDMWNNPIIPDYSNYIMIAQGGTELTPFGGYVPTLEEREHGCFVGWTFNFSPRVFEIVETLSSELTSVYYPEYGFTTWYYNYSWLAMDITDNDEDGVFDFIESQGVLGSNNHIYYSDPSALDGDGDTISDNEELGDIYTIHRTDDGMLIITMNQTTVYKSDDGIISRDSQYFFLSDYCNNLLCGQTKTIAIVKSDANIKDSDQDELPDNADRNPLKYSARYTYNREALRPYVDQYSILNGYVLRIDNVLGHNINRYCFTTNYNHDYPFYNSSDCAGFVSQCANHCGLPMDDEWYAYINPERVLLSMGGGVISYTYERFDVSPAWRQTQEQYDYFSESDYCAEVVVINGQDVVNGCLPQIIQDHNIQVGDLLFMDAYSDGSINHSTIISNIDNGMIQYSAHTESRLDRDLYGAVIDEDNVYHEYTFYVVTIQE